MKKNISFLLTIALLFSVSVFTSSSDEMSSDCISAILIEQKTGTVLFEQNADERLYPASVTKIMTMLLVIEAVEKGKASFDDIVRTSAAASKMGGSQIYLKEGEEMKLRDMLKCVAVASANDCAYALAEHISGSEEAFVKKMNERAAELNMNDTHFVNTNGLDDSEDAENHKTTARDISIMSRELLKHEEIYDYTKIWMDTVRDGTFGITNTNRLVRFYKGCTGLKTGSTDKAGYCISASAERDGMQLIAVIMGAETREIRNAEAVKLLDYGFAEYSLCSFEKEDCGKIRVLAGEKGNVTIESGEFNAVVPKGCAERVTIDIELSESTDAPVEKGAVVGSIGYYLDGKLIGKTDILTVESDTRMGFMQILKKIFEKFLIY